MNTWWKRLIGVVSLFLILLIIAYKSSSISIGFIGSLIVIIILLYFVIEVFAALVKSNNYLIIYGFIILSISLITFIMGLWEVDKQFISKSFIISVAIAATSITFFNLINVTQYKKNTKKIINASIFTLTSLVITVILMFSTMPSINSRIEGLNTDYLAFISLGITISTMGLMKENNEKSRCEKDAY